MLARQKSPLTLEGKVIHFFPDLPAEMVKQLKFFDDSRMKLKMLVPHGDFSTLIISMSLITTLPSFFISPQEAGMHLNTLNGH